MYQIDDENRFLEVTYQGGDKEVLYFKDFASGAMIENIVRRAKKIAVKREIAEQGRGLRKDDLLDSIRQEFRENEDLPNTTNPDDWAKISGKKGERIIFIRTLINREKKMTLRAVARFNTWVLGSTSSAMAIAKVMGIETEYGIAGGPDSDPIPRRASSSTPTPSKDIPESTGTSKVRRPIWTRAAAST